MGLAPYGEPTYKDLILKELIDIKEDGSFRMNMEYFDYPAGLKMTNEKFNKLFGGLPRKPETKLTQKEKEISYRKMENEEIPKTISNLIAQEKVIGWFQGRMEFGPRALGARSIIGDARSPQMQAQMNLKIKFREGFRPFAPSVLAEKANEYFDINVNSPYMFLVAYVKKDRQKKMNPDEQKLFGIEKLNIIRSDIPAVTHC